MPHQFTMTRRVEFAETDAAGVVHFSVYFRYMEEAEHAFCRSLGGRAYTWTADGIEGLPRVAVSCEYRRPLRYPEEVDVQLIVRDKSAKSITYEVRFWVDGSGDEGERVEAARGTMKVVHVERCHGSLEWRSLELPAPLRDRVRVAPPGFPDEEPAGDADAG